VFPGGELVRLTDVIRSAEIAGFEVVDVENLRPHYALTCRAWVNALQKNRVRCLECVDTETYRTWLLYLAACAASFEAGETEIHQVLLAKRGASRPWTRDYIYATN
jgi:cyclopropane-fatty-acyl-phospholipid synthase